MKKITKRGLQNFLANEELLGISYTAVLKGEDGDVYTFKPNLRTVIEDLWFHDSDDYHEMSCIITGNPRADAERERDNSMGLLFETCGAVAVLEPEGLSMGDLRQPKVSSVDKLLRHDKYQVAVPSVGTVTQMTIAGARVNVVELSEESEEEGLSIKLQMVFGTEKNLYPLTTYINDNLTKADLGKFLKLLNEGLVSGNIVGANYKSPQVELFSVNDFGGIRGGSIQVELDTSGGKGKSQVVLKDVSVASNTVVRIIPNKVKFEIIPDTKNYVLTITQHEGHVIVLSIK